MKYTKENIIEIYKGNEKLEFLFFWGHSMKERITKSCFSQWFPCEFEEKGIIYQSAEHYMMAEKARLFNDEAVLNEILKSAGPDQAKKLGRNVSNFDSHIWDEHKYNIVKKGNFLKFSQNPDLKEFLISTNDLIIVEASPYDGIWGIGMLENDPKAGNPSQWNGENLLGFVLMEVRDQLTYKN